MKAQVGIEFVMVMGLAMLFSAVLLSVAYFNYSDKIDEKRFSAANSFARQLQDELITASVVSDGYHRRLFFPSSIANSQYDVYGYNKSLSVIVGDQIVTYPVPFFVGNLTKNSTYVMRLNGEVIVV